jgi:hypothetical protein
LEEKNLRVAWAIRKKSLFVGMVGPLTWRMMLHPPKTAVNGYSPILHNYMPAMFSEATTQAGPSCMFFLG